MSNLIQIKRSLNTSTPASLANGELAYTANGDVLFIGSNNAVVAVGGARTPGVLTANQALVANSLSGIDQIKVGNLQPGSIFANGSLGTSGQTLLSNGTAVYWGTGTAGSNTAIQFNDSGEANGVAGFTFDKTTNAVFVGNVVTVGANVKLNTTSLSVGNATVNTVINSTSITTGTFNGTFNVSPNVVVTLQGDVAGSGNTTLANLANGTITIQTTIQADSVALGTDTTGDYVATLTAGKGLSGSVTGEGSNPTLAVVANSGIISNSSGVFANVDNSTIELAGGHLAVKDLGVQLGVKTSGDYVATITGGNGLSGTGSGPGSNPTFAVNAGNGIASNSSGVHVVAGTGVVSNSTGVHIGQSVGTTDNVTFNDVTVNGNTILGSASTDRLTVAAEISSNLMPSTNATYSIGNNSLAWFEVHAQNVHSEYGFFDKDVTISGNLIVTGNVVSINVSTLSISDSLIHLASENETSDSIDIGFIGHYSDDGGTTKRHSGLFRDASDNGFYKLFNNYVDAGLDNGTTSVIDTTNATFHLATLNAYLDSSGLFTNATHVALIANSTVNVSITANTLSLSTPLSGTSGGIGLNSYTAEDILVANSSNGFRKLALGTDGYVLQSNGTAVVYSTLDGGTF